MPENQKILIVLGDLLLEVLKQLQIQADDLKVQATIRNLLRTHPDVIRMANEMLIDLDEESIQHGGLRPKGSGD